MKDRKRGRKAKDTIAKIAAGRKFIRRNSIALTNNNKQLSLRNIYLYIYI